MENWILVIIFFVFILISTANKNEFMSNKKITTDIPVTIFNKDQKYLAMNTNNSLGYSDTKAANVIFRNPPGLNYMTNRTLMYTDLVIIQSISDQSTTNTSNCGWYGCRVLNEEGSFSHGGDDPAVFRIMPPPFFTTVSPDEDISRISVNDSDPICIQYAGTLSEMVANPSANLNMNYTSNCGWYGCRVLNQDLTFGHGGGDANTTTQISTFNITT